MWSRRVFLKSGALAVFAAGWGGSPAFIARAAAAAGERPGGRRKVLVAIFQRGAMDGLMAVPPLDERRLASLRPRLAMSAASGAGEEKLLDLGCGYGLHPAFSDLLPLWRDGRLAIVHAVGSPDPTRSHFDAQDYMESGTPGRKGTASGWLNRAVGLAGHEAVETTPFRAVALTQSLPRALHGEATALAVENLSELRVGARGSAASAAAGGFESLYAESRDELLRASGRDSFEAMRVVAGAEFAAYRPAGGARYPRGPLGDAMRQIAQLVKAGVGLEVAFAETGGWDTHVQQGTTSGSFARRARELGAAIAAFWTDLGSHRDEVMLLTMTEFGRTAAENGSGGTDHGHGSCLFALGNEVRGGEVHGSLPSLERDALYEGRDLPVTTDFRAVFAAVAGRQLGVVDDARLFPGWQGERLPLLRGS